MDENRNLDVKMIRNHADSKGRERNTREYEPVRHTNTFDRVNHDILMSRIARKIEDKRVLKLIRRFLESGMMDNGVVTPRDKGNAARRAAFSAFVEHPVGWF